MVLKKFLCLFSILFSIVGTKALAYDIAIENADGVTIYYNYISNGTELEVTYGQGYGSSVIAIPETVTFMSRTRKVTSIGLGAFSGSWYLNSVTIPNSVTSIGDQAFSRCPNLTSVMIPENVKSIGKSAFNQCSGLTTISLGNSVTSIEDYTFQDCINLTSITIPYSVTSIGDYAFCNCGGLTSVSIGNSVTSIGDHAFLGCRGLTSITIPNSVTSIGIAAFGRCSELSSITIPNNVASIGESAFSCDILEVISKIENPFTININTFSENTFYNATLYVPKGTIDKYKATEGWKKFAFIKEGNGSDVTPPSKCEKPTINYQNGKLTFHCATEGAICYSTITDSDITSYTSNEVQLTVTYNISVYATKEGYDNSDVATATLCWIDVDPKTEGINNSIANVRAMAVMVQNTEGQLIVYGVDDGTQINVYNTNGTKAGSAISRSGSAVVNTNLQLGSVAIVKIGESSIKVVLR